MEHDGWRGLKVRVILQAALGAILVAGVLGMKLNEGPGHRYYFSIELSRDGGRIVRSVDKVLLVEEVGTGRRLHEDGGLCAPARLSDDGRTLAVGGGAFERGEVVLLDPWTGEERMTWRRSEFQGGPLEVSPDGRFVAFGGHEVGLLDLQTCALRWTAPFQGSQVRSVRFVGGSLRIADEAGFVKNLELASGKVVSVLRSPEPGPSHPGYWGAGVGAVLWFPFWVPLWQRASALRRGKTSYQPRHARSILVLSAIYLAASIVLPVLVPGKIDLSGWLVLIQVQFVGLVVFLLSGIAFLSLRIPFRKSAFFGGLPLIAGGLFSQAWIWDAICSSV